MNTKSEIPLSGAGAVPDQAATPVEAAKREPEMLKRACDECHATVGYVQVEVADYAVVCVKCKEADLTPKSAETVSLEDALQRYIQRDLATAPKGWPQHTVRRGVGLEAKRFKFEGLRVADYSTRWVAGRENSRWTEAELFALKDGRFLLAEEEVTCWQGEENEYSVEIHDNLEAVKDQRLLDDLRKYLCEELNVKISVTEVAAPLSELEAS